MWIPGTGPGTTDTDTEDEMGFKCGIVGLPNVGKSTLFNALTETAAAQAANYPFCTIEPRPGLLLLWESWLGTKCSPAPAAASG